MNRITSYFIIIIIAYISYDYCSQTVEGQVGITPNIYQGYYDTSGDAAITPEQLSKEEGTGITCTPAETSNPDNVCYYKGGDCKILMDQDGWANDYQYDTDNKNRTRCGLCLQANNSMGTATNYVARIGLETGGNSEFAKHYCDAMMGCGENEYWYAVDETDFDNECSKVKYWPDEDANTVMTQFICNMMTNPVFEFIFSFLGGISCTLKIQALKLEDKIEAIPHEALCSMCGDLPNPIPCPKDPPCP